MTTGDAKPNLPLRNGNAGATDDTEISSGDAPELSFDMLLATLPGMVYRCLNDARWTAEFVSDGAYEVTGYRPQQLLGKQGVPYAGLIHPDDRERVYRDIQDAIEKHQAFRLTYRITTASGSQKWVWEQGTALHDANGRLLALQGYVVDITPQKDLEQALRQREERLDLITDAASDVLWDWDLTTDAMWWHASQRSPFGLFSQDVHSGESWLRHVAEEDRERVERGVQKVLAGDTPYWSDEYRLIRKDGAFSYVLDRGCIVRDAEGKAARMVGVLIDNSARKQAELERMAIHARLRQQAALLDKASDAITVRKKDGRISYWNKAAEHLFGWTAEEAVGKTMLELGAVEPAPYYEAFRCVLALGDWRGEMHKRCKNGGTIVVEARFTLVRDDAGNPQSILAIEADITQRKADERKIEMLAFFDPLTGLPNRRLLLDRLQHALVAAQRSGRKGALLFIDLDNFKRLNDTLGHDKGDMLLQQVARRLEASVRKCNTVARLGGDEFVVVLEDLGGDARSAASRAEMLGEKILAGFNAPFQLAGYEHHSTPSIGIALFDGESIDIDELMKRADLAMYQAKAAGRNAIRFFDPAMQAAITARVGLESDFRHGLRQQQFSLHFQSQIDAAGRAQGVEALARWKHPHRGLVSPALFIPLAEETGLIMRLGRWVLESACRQLAVWASVPEKSHLSIAVNVSAQQFRHPGFVEQVLSVLRATGADPKKLKLELTESLLVQNMEDTVKKMIQLKGRGIGFSLDDFGTGYSSLSYLKRLPLDQLKIDQSFIRDVLTDPNDAVIARTIVALGRSLSLEVIAEGVETEDQRSFLEQQGCYVYQGYLFSRPVPAEQF